MHVLWWQHHRWCGLISYKLWQYDIFCNWWRSCNVVDIGTMRLYTALSSGSVQVWNRTGDAGNFWVYAAVNITTTARFELAFDAEIGKLLLSKFYQIVCFDKNVTVWLFSFSNIYRRRLLCYQIFSKTGYIVKNIPSYYVFGINSCVTMCFCISWTRRTWT